MPTDTTRSQQALNAATRVIIRNAVIAGLATATLIAAFALATKAHAEIRCGRFGCSDQRQLHQLSARRHSQARSEARARGYVDANGNRLSLVGYINYKLRKYVHRTGKCGLATETLTTYYWQGSRVASGGRFHPHGLTAAHRTLPFGTHLHIVNPHNERSVDVVVNDRGPYTNAKLDLSLGAAQALGLTQSSYLCVSGL